MRLYGLTPPTGEGSIVEVHLDIQSANPFFSEWVSERGFEDDPFEIFFPAGYTQHLTGRIRVPKKQLSMVMPQVKSLVDEIIAKARDCATDLYAEIEIVQEKHYFGQNDSITEDGVLDTIELRPTNRFGGAKADIHLEFVTGTVSARVRSYLEEKGFYWVKTPETALFPSEEIATLQTETFGGAKQVFDLLVKNPLSAATGIHLELKFDMLATQPSLAMPRVFEVVRS